MRILARAFLFALLAAFVVAPAGAQQTNPPMPPGMPPGMTPAIMKMMMTPLKTTPQNLPKGVKAYFGCVPAMGYHYAAPNNWPLGPLYGYYEGKPVFTEMMPTKKQFEAGFNIDDQLKPLPGYTIDHVDIWYQPHGHPGMEGIPHYDIHAWYVPHSQHMKFCKNVSGKRPAFE